MISHGTLVSHGGLVNHSTLSAPSSPPLVILDHFNEDISSIFKRLDNISEPKKLSIRKDLKSSKSKSVIADKRGLHTEVAADITTVLRRLQAALRSNRWSLAALFYERMVCSQKLLPESQALHYQQILSLYLDVLDAVPSDIRHSMGEFAYNLLSFLQSHTVDPDSALIGLSPADDVVHKLSENSDFSDSCRLSKDELVKHVMQWSQMSDGEAIMQAVRVCAASFRGVDRLRRGDVAVLRLTNGKFVFGRYAGERTENAAGFYIDPLETSVVHVDVWDVWPITKSIADGTKDVKGMEKLIRQAIEAFFASLHQDVKVLTLSSLSAVGINVAVTERATELKMVLSDLDDLKFINTKLADMYADANTPVFKQCENFIRHKVNEYIAQLDSKTMFMPKYNATMQVLREYPKIPLARSRVRQLLGTCELALDQLKTNMRRILNGGLKAQITEWWLQKIETKVNNFLQAHGYEFTAVPDNYIEQPPENLEAVRINLTIVTQTLDPLTPRESSPLPLIKELRDEIYPVIDEFMHDSIIALCDHLDLDSKPLLNPTAAATTHREHEEVLTAPVSFGFNATPAIPILKAALDKKIATSTATYSSSPMEPSPLSANMVLLFEQLGDMIRDLEYLGSMKALEDNPNPTEKSLHIVPVGGLVIGSFLRLENELKTVLELWDVQDDQAEEETDTKVVKRTRADSEKAQEEKAEATTYVTEDDANATEFTSEEATELHWAVCSGKPEKVREALALPRIRATINTPDPHGWTPLHMASVLGNWETFELLLDVEGIDVTATNEKGGVVLHYIVKHPHSVSQTAMIKKLLDLHPALITAKNRHAETPLHSACLKANQTVVAQLVGCQQVEVNGKTIGGETPLHYAVTAGSSGVVSVLLKAGADPSIEAKRGAPLDLALGYKHFDIATFLRKALGMAEDHGWPRTTRTPPGQHAAPNSRVSLTLMMGSGSGLVAGGSGAADFSTLPGDANSRHIQIGTRQPRRGSRSRARMPDKPVLLGMSPPREGPPQVGEPSSETQPRLHSSSLPPTTACASASTSGSRSSLPCSSLSTSSSSPSVSSCPPNTTTTDLPNSSSCDEHAPTKPGSPASSLLDIPSNAPSAGTHASHASPSPDSHSSSHSDAPSSVSSSANTLSVSIPSSHSDSATQSSAHGPTSTGITAPYSPTSSSPPPSSPLSSLESVLSLLSAGSSPLQHHYLHSQPHALPNLHSQLGSSSFTPTLLHSHSTSSLPQEKITHVASPRSCTSQIHLSSSHESPSQSSNPTELEDHPSWNTGSVIGSFSRSIPSTTSPAPTYTHGNSSPSTGSPKSTSQGSQRWVPERQLSISSPHLQPPQPLFQLPQFHPSPLPLPQLQPQLQPHELAESSTNWHTARIRRGHDSKRNMVALRTHNKTLSDGSMSFLTKIQSELLSSRSAAYRSGGDETKSFPVAKGFATLSSETSPQTSPPQTLPPQSSLPHNSSPALPSSSSPLPSLPALPPSSASPTASAPTASAPTASAPTASAPTASAPTASSPLVSSPSLSPSSTPQPASLMNE